MSIKITDFGKASGREAKLISLSNKNGMTVNVTDFGANVVNIIVPDKNGNLKDVIIGYNSAQEYADGGSYHGATVGRYANRIRGGKFTLNGKEYQLALNNLGVNSLHGGNVGYNKLFWDILETADGDEPSFSLTLTDPDGRENYPGTVKVTVKFSLSENNEFKTEYFAVSDKDTIVNLTNHSYFNLSGCVSGDISDHLVKINGEYFTPTDRNFIPTGEIESVYGTVLDFTDFRRIGDGFDKEYKELEYQGGYDHNFILKDPFTLREIATVKDPASGRVMRVYSDMPAVQFYTGNMIDGLEKGKDGKAIKYRSGFCIEPQFSPDSPNLDDRFPSCVLKANERYAHTNIYKFETE